jgi:phosphoglucosamine mutase
MTGSRLFGTDGIRGIAGQPPLDPPTVERIGAALARVLGAAAGRSPRVLIGRDTRESGPSLEAALARGLAAGGGRADRGGVLTTPAIACLARLLGYDAGVVISASHNPYRDNGIKVFGAGGDKLAGDREREVERLVLDRRADAGPTGAPRRAAAGAPEPIDASVLRERYLGWLRQTAGDAALAGWRIVLDCAHGAASPLAPEAFRRFGAEVIALHTDPDGRNINERCGSLHPEALAAAVVRTGARLGLAFDGDADRCIPVDGSGRILNGDHVLYLAARDLRTAGRLPGNSVVGTVMSNLWLERALALEGIGLVRAAVGDRHVLEEMRRGASVLGGEQSGHVIFLEKTTTGDGILTGILFADLVRRSGLDLAAWAAGVRPCPQVLVNVPVRERPPLETHPLIGPAIRSETERLGAGGRLLVRYSGTEAQARIMVEGESAAAVEQTAARLGRIIRDAIGRDAS